MDKEHGRENVRHNISIHKIASPGEVVALRREAGDKILKLLSIMKCSEFDDDYWLWLACISSCPDCAIFVIRDCAGGFAGYFVLVEDQDCIGKRWASIAQLLKLPGSFGLDQDRRISGFIEQWARTRGLGTLRFSTSRNDMAMKRWAAKFGYRRISSEFEKTLEMRHA